MLLILARVSQTVATPFCSGSAIIANRQYKHNAFQTPEKGCGPLTMESVANSHCMEMMKNANMLRMLSRGAFAHTRNSTGSTFSSLVAVSSPFLQNVLANFTRQVILDSIIFRACTHKLLMLVSYRFVSFEHFSLITHPCKSAWERYHNHVSGLHPRQRPSKRCCGSLFFAKLLLPH